MRGFLTYHLPVLAYGALILAVSSIPDLHTPGLRILAADKIAHFLEYALFAFLVYRSMRHLTAERHALWSALLAVLFVALFAAGDEILQKHTRGRHSDIRDFAADVVGGTLVVLILWVRQRRRTVAPSGSDRFFNSGEQP